MTDRLRTRSHGLIHGTNEVVIFGTSLGVVTNDVNRVDETTADVVGDFGGNHNFLKYSTDLQLDPHEAMAPPGPYMGTYFHNWLPGPASSIPHAATHLDTDPLPDLTAFDVLSRTNPNRPDVTPLSLMQDLVDIPRQLRDVGKLFNTLPYDLSPREVANQNLSIQFGWLPLFSDVKNLLHLQGRMDNRFKRLRYLYAKGGETRRIHVGSSNAEDTVHRYLIGGGFGVGNLYSDIKIVTTQSVWYTARFKLLVAPKHYPNYQQMRDLAFRISNGLTVRGLAEGVWDLIPWTWLIDWFTDTGNLLIDNLNTIPIVPGNVCKMTHTTTYAVHQRHLDSSEFFTSGGNGYTFYETKRREPLSSGPSLFRLPNISLDALSILGSLFVQRFHR